MKYHPKKNAKKKRHIGLWIVLCLVAALAIAGTIVYSYAHGEYESLKYEAELLKTDLQDLIIEITDMNPDKSEAVMEKISDDSNRITARLDNSFWQSVTKIPKYGETITQDINSVKKLLSLLDDTKEEIFFPFTSMMRNYPLDELKKTEDGLNVGILLKYLDFLDQIEPNVVKITSELDSTEFNYVDLDLKKYSSKITEIFEQLNEVDSHRELIRLFLGNGEDRLYLVMAQNTAEIRASGGFPGSMGLIRIENGILSIGDFSSVRNFLQTSNTEESGITDTERELFQYMYSRWSHDACYNPHFAKVAHITEVAYKNKNNEKLDGIIALTPEIIQKILALTGDEITLDDGTILNGENATKIIQRDLYYKYQSDNQTAIDNNSIIDSLFAETAKQSIKLLLQDISLDNIAKYLEFMETLGENRTMLLWFADEDEEAIAEKNHCSGNLNSDSKNPVAGVYFSCSDPGKLGMFTALDVTVSSPKVGVYGIKEYNVRVTFNNYINVENVTDINSWYLLGSNNKAIQGYAYFFAPAGGSVSDFKVSNGMTVKMSQYENLQVGYLLNLFLQPGKPVTITYKLKTGPGPTAPLQIDKTPTLQNYR